VFTKLFPARVLSLALTNSFCNTTTFHDDSTLWTNAYAYMPDFYLRNLILEKFPQMEEYSPGVADAIDFQVLQLENLTQEELAARFTLNVTIGSSHYISRPGCLALSDEQITFIDSLDSTTIPRPLKDQLYTVHPEAKQAFLKSGGDFPFLSRWQEVNMHLVVHLRRNGLRVVNTNAAAFDARPTNRGAEEDSKVQPLRASALEASLQTDSDALCRETENREAGKENSNQLQTPNRRAPPPPPGETPPAPPPRPTRPPRPSEQSELQKDGTMLHGERNEEDNQEDELDDESSTFEL
jgi:hypothetical protein